MQKIYCRNLMKIIVKNRISVPIYKSLSHTWFELFKLPYIHMILCTDTKKSKSPVTTASHPTACKTRRRALLNAQSPPQRHKKQRWRAAWHVVVFLLFRCRRQRQHHRRSPRWCCGCGLSFRCQYTCSPHVHTIITIHYTHTLPLFLYSPHSCFLCTQVFWVRVIWSRTHARDWI